MADEKSHQIPTRRSANVPAGLAVAVMPVKPDQQPALRVMDYPHRIVIAARAFLETDYSVADIQAELGLSDDETELARDVARSFVVQRRPRR